MRPTLVAAAARALMASLVAWPGIPPTGLLDLPADPVTERLVGSVSTYDVGPGQTYEDIDDVPWGNIVDGGVVVNIHHREAPYTWRFGLCARGASNAWIVINGVTDAAGSRPVFDFTSAPMAPSCQRAAQGGRDIFGATPAYGEDLGCIVVKPPATGATQRPAYIRIQHLELRGGHKGLSYTTVSGGTSTNGGQAIYLLRCGDFIADDAAREDHIVVENCVIHDCGQGVFTQQSNNSLDYTCHNVTLRRNRVYGNGVAGSSLEHNVYIQCTRPLVEHNYFGQLRAGAQGSAYKSRCYREVFRFNYVEAHARAIDWVHPEDQDDAVVALAGHGVDVAYGNVIVVDWTLPQGGAYRPIHFGGDNSGEDQAAGGTHYPGGFPEYRKRLYFWSNTFAFRSDGDPYRRLVIFNLSTNQQHVYAWNNLLAVVGGAMLSASWLEYSGTLHLLGTNLMYSPDNEIGVSREDAEPGLPVVDLVGTLLTGDPLFVDETEGAGDWGIGAGSPAVNAGGAVPSGLPDAAFVAAQQLTYSPRLRSNGGLVRTATGGVDLGASELDTTTPVNTEGPSISGELVPGETLTADPGAWTNSPTLAYQWLREGVAISGATGSTYTTGPADGGQQLRVRVTATNPVTGRVGVALSAPVSMEADPNAPANTELPSISGNLFLGGTATAADGDWTNSPTGITRQWLRGGEGGLAVGTGTTYTFVEADVGAVFALRVTATNASGSASASSVATAAIGGAQALEPDGTGKFTFSQPNGTLVGALNDALHSPGNGVNRFECVDGALQCVDGTGGFGERVYFDNGQGADQVSEGEMAAGMASDAEMILTLQSTDERMGYYVRFTPTQVHVYNAAGYVTSASHGINVATTALKGRISVTGNSYALWVNGASYGSMDVSAGRLTGGYPGFSLTCGADESGARLNYWTDQ